MNETAELVKRLRHGAALLASMRVSRRWDVQQLVDDCAAAAKKLEDQARDTQRLDFLELGASLVGGNHCWWSLTHHKDPAHGFHAATLRHLVDIAISHFEPCAAAVKKWPVWMEGYTATEDRGTAEFCGVWPGATFADACAAWARETRSPQLFDREKLTFWGCRLFDSEAAARKAFG